MAPRLILVTGATGAVGAQIVRALDDSGYGVRVLALDPPTADLRSFITEMQLGDITDPATVNRAMEDVQGVIHLAALLHIVNPLPALKTKYERINVGGTATVWMRCLRQVSSAWCSPARSLCMPHRAVECLMRSRLLTRIPFMARPNWRPKRSSGSLLAQMRNG